MSEDAQLFTLRREREMTRTHAILWGVILLATVTVATVASNVFALLSIA